MKNIKYIMGFLILAMLLIAGCTKQENGNAGFTDSLTYSNLSDKASQDEVREALIQANIPEKSIEEFFAHVEEFNQMVEYKTLTKDGFETIEGLSPEYDLESMAILAEEKSPDFIGYNCRLTSLGLMKEFVEMGNPIVEVETSLPFDRMALSSKPELFTEEEQKIFMSLFSDIPAERTNDMNVHLNTVKKSWETKGLHFKNEDKATLISVIFHFDDGVEQPTVFIGHMGVLLHTADGKLMFLEKLSFQEPYQAIKFENKIQLNDYLMNKYDTDQREEAVHPFILENGELMEGYRLNPKNSNEP